VVLSKRNKTAYAMSRRWRAAIFALALLVVTAFISIDHGLLRYQQPAQSQTHEQSKSSDFEKYHKKNFTVVNVVDGDTIDIDVSDGRYEHSRIRLWGVDTPETKNNKTGVMYFGPQAGNFARQLVLGKQVCIYIDEQRTRDKYGRLLAYVQLPDGRFLNEVLIAEGFAYADLRFQHSFYYKYQQAEAVARRQKKGLWREVTRNQLPEWLQRERPKLLLEK